MSLVYKSKLIVSIQSIVTSPYDFTDEKTKEQHKGVSIYSDVTALSADGSSVAVIRMKGKSEDEVRVKLHGLAVGKAADIAVRGVASVSRGVLTLNG